MKLTHGFRKYTGLMFRTSKTEPLLFKFNKPVNYQIHSYFVFFPFTAVWTFEDGSKEERIIYPFQDKIKPAKPFISLEEYPIKKLNVSKITNVEKENK